MPYVYILPTSSPDQWVISKPIASREEAEKLADKTAGDLGLDNKKKQLYELHPALNADEFLSGSGGYEVTTQAAIDSLKRANKELASKQELSQQESTQSAAASRSAATAHSAGGVSQQKSSFYQSNSIGIPQLDLMPKDLLNVVCSYLDNNALKLLPLARTNKEIYNSLYVPIKRAMVKMLKDLVEKDDTARVAVLVRANPKLLLREDEHDPQGLAYKNIETTPYQDTLADPLLKEMRTLLAESFRGGTKEEKLAHAALQAEEFKHPRFNKFREEKQKFMEQTKFAYETYLNRLRAWDGNSETIQPVRDAWMRVDLAQNQWSKRLRKIFSIVNMDENQTFENLPRDLPEPHFNGNTNDLWLPGTIKGCDLGLQRVTADQDLEAADFRANLGRTSGGCPVLIRRGEGEAATYHLYAPHISLDRDESEWRIEQINDPNIRQLIKLGRPAPGVEGNAVNFNQPTLPYSPIFEDLYKFGHQRGLHLGSGYSYIFATCNWGARWSGRGRGGECGTAARSNFAAVTALYEKRVKDLATHLNDLEQYLPGQERQRLTPGS